MSATKKKTAHWFLYILKCSDGSLYTGITNDLSRRLSQHNHGRASRYTRGRLPVRLVHQERCRDRSHALKQEHAIKSMARKEKKAYIAAARRRATASVPFSR